MPSAYTVSFLTFYAELISGIAAAIFAVTWAVQKGRAIKGLIVNKPSPTLTYLMAGSVVLFILLGMAYSIASRRAVAPPPQSNVAVAPKQVSPTAPTQSAAEAPIVKAETNKQEREPSPPQASPGSCPCREKAFRAG